MSFLAGLAGGFGQALADDQKDKNEWLRDQKLMNKRYAMTTGTAALKKAQAERDTVLRQADYIQKRGITKNSLMYLWDEGGVNAISDIYNLIQNTHKDATKEEINNMANAAKNYASAENKPFAEVLSNARGLYSQEMPKRKERTALQKIFGDPTNEAFYDDGSVYEGKYTVTDMYRIQGSGFEGGTGSVVFDEDAAPMKRSPQYDAAINNNIVNAREIISSKAQIQIENKFKDATKFTTYKGVLISSAAANDYSDMLNNPELKPYAINILQPYIDAEMEGKGSVLNNSFVSPKIKNNIRQIMSGDFDEEPQESTEQQIKNLISTNPELKNKTVVKSDEALDLYNNNKLPEGDFLFVEKNGQVVIKNTQSLVGSSSGSAEMPTDVELIAYIRDKDKIPEGNKNFNIPNSELLKKAKLEAKVIKIGEDNPYFPGKTEITYEEWMNIGYKLPDFYRQNPGIPRDNAAWLATPASKWLTKTNK
tara:strand:+ start:2565 stop:4001 length:1437 start_codon:yes stop_codon:yes gene_type:complete